MACGILVPQPGIEPHTLCIGRWSLNNWADGELPSFLVCKMKLVWASQVALVVKNTPANAGDTRDTGLIPGLGRSPGEGYGNPLQYSC